MSVLIKVARRVIAKNDLRKSCRDWFKAFQGTDLVRAYRKHFRTSWSCAIIELAMLGVQFPPEQLEEARRKQVGAVASVKDRKRKKAAKKAANMSEEQFL